MIKIDITKKLRFAGSSALTVQHQFNSGEISAVYGPSGAGKTTLLKIIAGLITPERGFIEVDGKVWLDTAKKINVPVQQRNIGFVFQDYALFPNMTVRQNLRYAAGKNPDMQQVNNLLTITGLNHFANEKPETLSGGQKQRTALARALVRKPGLLLLDEPLSATDETTRYDLQQQILHLQAEYKFIALVVSHNRQEVITLANHILQLDNGNVVNTGSAKELFGENEVLTIRSTISRIANGQMEITYGENKLLLKHRPGLALGDTVSINFDTVTATISKA